MRIKVFYLEPTDRERRWLRRFSFQDKAACAKNAYGCDASFEIGEADIRYTADGAIDATGRDMPPKTDPRWPVHCAACGRAFTAADEYQLSVKQIYLNADRGVRCTLREAPVGACWNAWRIADRRSGDQAGVGWTMGDDGRSLVVRCPDGHDWHIDARASNCTMPADNSHHCWVRHGSPEAGDLHVDKNGKTCGAGVGSIQTPKWHGFLHHGELHE